VARNKQPAAETAGRHPLDGLEGVAASQRVTAYLRNAILSDAIQPGERIRQEDVAEALGASRLPVREALRTLEAEGLIEHEPNKGARVPLLGARDVDLLYQMRERLEPLALAESMLQMTDEHLDHLVSMQAEISRCADVATFMALDREFHLLMYAHCDMETLSTTVLRLWNSTQHYRRVFMNTVGSGQRWIINAEHDLLLDALRRRDPVDAGRCLVGHVRRTRVELSRHAEVFEPAATG
jgi:DNA-binding GntR family transcriptional regulator